MPYDMDVVPPALGMRLKETAAEVLVQINDLGGRGWPWSVIFIPVRHDGTRWQPVRPVEVAAADKAPADQAAPSPPSYPSYGHWMRQKQDVAPYLLRVPQADWPRQGDAVLVLLQYFQAKGIGGLPDIADELDIAGAPRGRRAVDASEFWLKLAAAVRARLAVSSADALAGGIIRHAAATPVAATPPATPEPAPARAYAAASVAAGKPSRRAGAAAAPASAQGRVPVRIALASCLHPSDVFDRMPDGERVLRGPADRALLALADRLQAPEAPTMLVLTGDQVYVDATAGLFDPRMLDDRYRIPYDRRGESRGVAAVQQRMGLDIHMLLDDHEIRDNWDRGDPEGTGPHSPYRRGLDAYWQFQRWADQSRQVWRDDVVHGGLPFFLADVRTERAARRATNHATRQIMRAPQCRALQAWLRTHGGSGAPLFLASSAPVLPRRLAVAHEPHAALHSDAWDGYPASLQALLATACDEQVRGLVILTGGDHLPYWVEARITRDDGQHCRLFSVHGPALYAPYPFANADPADYADDEDFEFSAGGRRYRCEVRTGFAPAGDGFVLLSACPGDESWTVRADVCSVAGGPGASAAAVVASKAWAM